MSTHIARKGSMSQLPGGGWVPTEASLLGFAPGEWPDSFRLPDGRLFVRGERQEVSGAFTGYLYLYRPVVVGFRVGLQTPEHVETVMVFND